MFEMHPGSLEMGMARRQELVRAEMAPQRAAERAHPRVAGVVRFRHAVATMIAALA
jgi:hypothetical protein